MKHLASTATALPYHSTMKYGDPFLSVYFFDEDVSFMWTGRWVDPITVHPGGLDQDTQFLISCDPNNNHFLSTAYNTWLDETTSGTPTPATVLIWFKGLCRRWLTAAADGYEGYAVYECHQKGEHSHD